MRIEYKILWVEDVKSWYEGSRDLASEYLDDLGFRLTSKLCKTFNEVKAEFELNQLKEYDLLLVDFTLAGSPNGDEIIKFIRDQKENPILTDVIFYSNDIESVRESIKKYELEGVYTAHRNDFTDKLELVIDTTIKKVQEVNPMRGLIMAETSDLDDLMLIIISKILKSGMAEIFEKYINDEIKESIDNVSKKALGALPTTDKITDSRIFTSFHRAKCINKLFKESTKNGNPIGVDKFFDSYNKEVISTRNNFAHVKESIENGEKVLISHATGKKEVFNEERCIQIRQSLIKYRETLENIDKQVDSLP